MRRHSSRILLLFVMLAAFPHAGWPQGDPLGPEFRVNSYTTSNQRDPSVAVDASGNFVVVWDSQQDPAVGVFGQRYNAGGAPLGPEFHINTFTNGFQGVPAVASDAAGNIIVVWSSIQDGFGYGVFSQRYAVSGAPLGSEFRVNTYTTYHQALASVAADPSGSFVVVWNSGFQDGSGYGVFGQRFASSGAPVGPEFRVNTYTTGSQYGSRLAVDGLGNFVVVWNSGQDGSYNGIFGQRFLATGVPAGPEFRVNTYTTNGQYHSSVAADAAGGFVVVWQSEQQDGSNLSVFGQRFLSTGAPAGPEFRVNTFTTGVQGEAAVSSDANGDFVVTWLSFGQDGSSDGIFGQRFAASGAPLGPEFRVNTYFTSDQNYPAVAANATGSFVVAWESQGQDGSAYGVFGQRFNQIVPVELMHFGIE